MTSHEKSMLRLSLFTVFGIIGLLARMVLTGSKLKDFRKELESDKEDVLSYWEETPVEDGE